MEEMKTEHEIALRKKETQVPADSMRVCVCV